MKSKRHTEGKITSNLKPGFGKGASSSRSNLSKKTSSVAVCSKMIEYIRNHCCCQVITNVQ